MISQNSRRRIQLLLTLLFVTTSGCTPTRQLPTSPTPAGGTSLMPPSYYTTYYSTQKARSLGEVYTENLDQLLTQLTQSSIGKLQFANAIVSLSLGFFTHAASQPTDQRYLEAIIGMPDILDEEKDFNTLVSQLFSQYGYELLSTLARDETIARDTKIAGYGLHFSWRSLLRTPSGPRLTMREAVVYMAKEQTQQFLGKQITQDMLLERATLFSRQGEQPAEQVQYVSPTPQAQPQTYVRRDELEVKPAHSFAPLVSPQPLPSTPTLATVTPAAPVQGLKLETTTEVSEVRKRTRKRRSTAFKRQHKRIVRRLPLSPATAPTLPTITSPLSTTEEPVSSVETPHNSVKDPAISVPPGP